MFFILVSIKKNEDFELKWLLHRFVWCYTNEFYRCWSHHTRVLITIKFTHTYVCVNMCRPGAKLIKNSLASTIPKIESVSDSCILIFIHYICVYIYEIGNYKLLAVYICLIINLFHLSHFCTNVEEYIVYES